MGALRVVGEGKWFNKDGRVWGNPPTQPPFLEVPTKTEGSGRKTRVYYELPTGEWIDAALIRNYELFEKYARFFDYVPESEAIELGWYTPYTGLPRTEESGLDVFWCDDGND